MNYRKIKAAGSMGIITHFKRWDPGSIPQYPECVKKKLIWEKSEFNTPNSAPKRFWTAKRSPKVVINRELRISFLKKPL